MENLFVPIVEESKLHRNFSILLDERFRYTREIIEQWADGFIDRDGKFILEFQTTFNGCFWELYLFAALRELGYGVDFSFASPDFVVESPRGPLCIEATIASNAIDSIPEWETQIPDSLEGRNLLESVDFATIRLANSVTSKHRKYQQSYGALPQVAGKPFVIAIAPFEQPFFYTQNQHAIRRALYGYEGPIYEDVPEEGIRIVHGHKYIDHILKPNGSPVPLGYFVQPGMEDISAVIFSNTATIGKVDALSNDPGIFLFNTLRYNKDGLYPRHQVLYKNEYQETLLDGLQIWHNPLTNRPLDPTIFDQTGVIQYSFDLDEGFMFPLREYDGTLIQRWVVRMVTVDK